MQAILHDETFASQLILHFYIFAGSPGQTPCKGHLSYLCPAMFPASSLTLISLASIPGAAVEHNIFCVSAHFRNCIGDSWLQVIAVVEAIVSKQPTLRMTRGRKVVEIRPQVRIYVQEMTSPAPTVVYGVDICVVGSVSCLAFQMGTGLQYKEIHFNVFQQQLAYEAFRPCHLN